jgi:hypothetical protein
MYVRHARRKVAGAALAMASTDDDAVEHFSALIGYAVTDHGPRMVVMLDGQHAPVFWPIPGVLSRAGLATKSDTSSAPRAGCTGRGRATTAPSRRRLDAQSALGIGINGRRG